MRTCDQFAESGNAALFMRYYNIRQQRYQTVVCVFLFSQKIGDIITSFIICDRPSENNSQL